MAAKTKTNALIFIDTNILLDFYRIRKSDISLKYLELIDKHKDKVITTSQVEMEFKKNRQSALLENIVKLKNESTEGFPAILSQAKAADIIIRRKKELSVQYNKLKAKIDKIFNNPSLNDVVYQTTQRLFKKNSPLNLNRTHNKRFEIRDLAKKRFELGYPPRKEKDTSFGDSVNWEWIVQCAIDTGKDIVIVSRDSDYGVTYSNDLFLNDWLSQEFKQRVGAPQKITLTDKLHRAFDLISVRTTKEMKKEEEKFIVSTSPLSELGSTLLANKSNFLAPIETSTLASFPTGIFTNFGYIPALNVYGKIDNEKKTK